MISRTKNNKQPKFKKELINKQNLDPNLISLYSIQNYARYIRKISYLYKVTFRFTKGSTYVTITKILNNQLIYSRRTGQLGFLSKIRKSPYAHVALIKHLGQFLQTYKPYSTKKKSKKLKVLLVFKGLEFGKSFVRRNLKLIPSLKIIKFIDLTNPPHNGCRLPIKRRL